jgi:hypothetical protein
MLIYLYYISQCYYALFTRLLFPILKYLFALKGIRRGIKKKLKESLDNNILSD